VCGDHPTIRELQDYEQFCGTSIAARSSLPADFDISPVELSHALDCRDAPLLLDVREPMEFKINRLPNSVLIPFGNLPDRLGEIDATRDVVVYCHYGIRSVRAVELLRAAGFRARNLHGGIAAWIDQVDPTMSRY
jgi:adenylyltransferase/sulfurtransferase